MQSPEEETVNVLTHGLGVLVSLVVGMMLIAKASHLSEGILVATAVFVLGMLAMLLSSTIYHAVDDLRQKQIFKTIDHICIYVMIAGTYTPFILVYYWNESGRLLLVVMWALVVIGTLFKIWNTGRFALISTITYVLMGLAILVVSRSFFPLVPPGVTALLIAGGASYLVGVVFYLSTRLKYHHAIWHVFVLGGAWCHAVGVYCSL